MKSNVNKIEDVAQIIWWNRVDNDHYQARVQYRDGTEGSYAHLTSEGWKRMKEAELQASVDEASGSCRRYTTQDDLNEKAIVVNGYRVYPDGTFEELDQYGDPVPTDEQIEEALIDQGDICPTCNGGAGGCFGEEAHGPNPYADIDPETFPLDERAEEISAYLMQTEHFGLCAWCKSIWDRKNSEPVIKLTDEEFEQTRKDGSSHGCCPLCHHRLTKKNR